MGGKVFTFYSFATTMIGSLSFRKIQFHPAKKQFNGFGSNLNNYGSDFWIVTLNHDFGQKIVFLLGLI